MGAVTCILTKQQAMVGFFDEPGRWEADTGYDQTSTYVIFRSICSVRLRRFVLRTGATRKRPRLMNNKPDLRPRANRITI